MRRRHSATSSPPSEKSGANRDPSLDNVRFLAAALVVVGHFLEPIRASSEIASTVYFATWPLRIPVLVVIAGYFSRSTFLDRVQMTALLRNVLLVYLAFHLISSVEMFLISGEVSYDPTTPTWGMWFLLSLFCWRVLLPYVSLFRATPAILVVGAVGAGFADGIGAQLSASRTIVYFPLFLLGHWLGAGGLQSIRALPHAKIVAQHLLAGIMLTGALLHHRITPLSLHMRDSYDFQQLPALPGLAPVLRLALLSAAALAILSLLVLVPRRRIPVVTYLGSGTMYAYLLHLLALTWLRTTDFYLYIDSRLEVAGLIVGGVCLAAVLASPPSRATFGWLVQPHGSWMFRSGPEQRTRGDRGPSDASGNTHPDLTAIGRILQRPARSR